VKITNPATEIHRITAIEVSSWIVAGSVKPHMNRNRVPAAHDPQRRPDLQHRVCLSHAATALLSYNGRSSGLGGVPDAMKTTRPGALSSRLTVSLFGL
jgi:hypothetical protein